VAAPGLGPSSRALRIAMMVESDGPGGAEVMVFELAEELRRRGHFVVPVGPPPDRAVGWLGSKFRNAGFTPENFRIRRPIDTDCARSLVEIFRKHQIDLVHSHEFTMAVYGTAATRWCSIPHVITFHSDHRICQAWRRRAAVRWAIQHSAATATVSSSTGAHLENALSLPPQTVHVVPNGVPIRAGDPTNVRAEIGCGPNDIVILAVGNLEVHKGHIVLLRALHRIATESPSLPWRLVIAGGRGGPEHLGLEQFARDHNLSDRIHILLHREDIPDLQAMAEVFVMPSLREGLPMALLEAMLAGKAIVASETSGIPEAIVSGEHGLLTPPGDVDALVAALRLVLASPERRLVFGAKAKFRGHANFAVGVMTDAYERLYGLA
jgi:glycosyltransferase involved in cell wall biosynthesis